MMALLSQEPQTITFLSSFCAWKLKGLVLSHPPNYMQRWKEHFTFWHSKDSSDLSRNKTRSSFLLHLGFVLSLYLPLETLLKNYELQICRTSYLTKQKGIREE